MTRPCRIDGCPRNAAPRRLVCWSHKNGLGAPLREVTHPDTIPPVVEDRLPDHGLTITDRRTAAQQLGERGVHASEIAALLGVTERTVYRWQAARKASA